jgi:4-carboxymuconolactone decarboxylase
MAKAPPSAKRDRIKNFTPALVDYTNDVVYGDLWERKGLSKRDRSLITVAALVATYRPEQLVSHLTRAIAFIENFWRYLKGEPLQNVVDKKAGY